MRHVCGHQLVPLWCGPDQLIQSVQAQPYTLQHAIEVYAGVVASKKEESAG